MTDDELLVECALHGNNCDYANVVRSLYEREQAKNPDRQGLVISTAPADEPEHILACSKEPKLIERAMRHAMDALERKAKP